MIDFRNLAEIASHPNVQKPIMAQMITDMEPFVPKRQGYLRANVQIEGNSIVYRMPYARKMFYGHYNYTTPGTGRRWDLVAKAKYMDSWQRVAAKAIAKELGNE